MGTNCLGPFLFTQFLLPILKMTAASSSKDSVRVAWPRFIIIDTSSPPGSIDLEDFGKKKSMNEFARYGITNCGNLFISKTLAK